MNILWLNWKDSRHPLAGGAEVVNEALAQRLAAHRHQVTFLTAGFPGAEPTEERDGYRVIRVGSRYTVYLAAWRYYRQHLRHWPDLVIDECNTMPFFAGWYTRRPTILFFHMLCRRIWFYQFPFPLSLIGYLAEPVYLRLLRRAPVVTVSDSTRHDLIRHGFRAADIHLISEGINLAPVPDLAAITKYPNITLLSLGAIRPMKRTLDQVQAFELARDRIANLRLKVAGDANDPYGRRVLAYIKASRYAADIEYLGHVTAEQKQILMQRSHLFLVTSIKEGWGLVVTEAASQGTPAVVYDVDGLRDSVRTGQTGLITPRNTPAALAGAVISTLADPAVYERYRQAAWEWSRHITFDQAYADFSQVLGSLQLQPATPGQSAAASSEPASPEPAAGRSVASDSQ